MTAINIPHTLDEYFQSTPLGSLERVLGNNLYGINHRQITAPLPMNKDVYGLTLLVRPQLKLLSENIRNTRLLYPLLTTVAESIPRFIRCTLDPRLAMGYYAPGTNPGTAPMQISGQFQSPFCDPSQAFIPVLSNNVASVSGWPDMNLPTFTSHEGAYGQTYAQADGIVRNYTAYDLELTFRNTRGDTILYMFYIWLQYMSMVFEGLLVPYPDFITENELDYCTRIYRLVLDVDRRYVKKIAATGVSFPTTVPEGQFFDYSTDHPYNTQSQDITVRFKSLGAQYHDDILIFEFNQTVCQFNPSMSDGNRDLLMIKVDATLLNLFNNKGYARINPSTYELEWWVDSALFISIVNPMIDYGLI